MQRQRFSTKDDGSVPPVCSLNNETRTTDSFLCISDCLSSLEGSAGKHNKTRCLFTPRCI